MLQELKVNGIWRKENVDISWDTSIYSFQIRGPCRGAEDLNHGEIEVAPETSCATLKYTNMEDDLLETTTVSMIRRTPSAFAQQCQS